MPSALDPPQRSFALPLGALLLSIFLVAWSSPDFVSWLLPEYLLSAPIAKNDRLNVSYRGVTSHGIEHFYNIFYAEDTSGPNRFAPPVRFAPTSGAIIDASAPGAFCAQGIGDAAFPFTSPTRNISENCLSLRVSRPRGIKTGSRLPVVVWIHGGGSALGTAYDQLYEPDGLIRQAKKNGQPILFVAMNYRLGIFGFATNKSLREKKHTNVGLRDQRAAFEWVKDNIAFFGGDPDNVTAMGQSVGASAIGLHLTSFKGKQGVPFHKAIMMSGASGLNFNIKSSLVADNTATVAQSLECVKEDRDSEATLECLRHVPMDKLMNVSVTLSRQLHPPFGELTFYPSYDRDYIADRPSQLLRSGQFVKGRYALITSALSRLTLVQAFPSSPPGSPMTGPGMPRRPQPMIVACLQVSPPSLPASPSLLLKSFFPSTPSQTSSIWFPQAADSARSTTELLRSTATCGSRVPLLTSRGNTPDTAPRMLGFTR